MIGRPADTCMSESAKQMDSVCFKWFGMAYGCHKHEYYIEGNLRAVEFSQMVDLYYFAGLIFIFLRV